MVMCDYPIHLNSKIRRWIKDSICNNKNVTFSSVFHRILQNGQCHRQRDAEERNNIQERI